MSKDLELLRKALIDEQEAINYYEDAIQQLQDGESRKVLSHISEEEKEHSAELLELIRKLDPVQAEKLKAELFKG